MNMFAKVKPKTVDEYMEAVPEERKEMVEMLDKLIRETAPSLKRYFADNMLGYGKFEYTNSKKEVVDWPVVAMANQKNYVSVYVCSLDGGEYVAEKYKDKLGKVSVGKSCIRLKKLEDVNMEELKKVIKLAEKKPGLVR